MHRWMVAFTLVTLATAAHAGLTCFPEDMEGFLRALEQYAKGPARMELIEDGHDCGWLHQATDAFKQRYFQACTAIVARRGADAQVKTQCAQESLMAGRTSLGDVDLFTVFRESDLDPIDDEAPFRLAALAASGDGRARTVIIAHYKKYLARAAKKPPKGSYAGSWVKWQVSVLGTLEKVATPEDRSFVDEVTASTKDRKVLDAAARLAAALDAKKEAPAR